MEQTITICNNYTRDTFSDFADFHCKKIQGIRYFRYLGVFMIGATVYFFIKSPDRQLINLIFNPGIILSLLFIGMSYWIPGNTAKQLYKSCAANGSLSNTIVFDSEKVSFAAANVKTVYFYKQLYKCYETEHYFYVYVRRSTAQIICKSACDAATITILREFMANEPRIKYINKVKSSN